MNDGAIVNHVGHCVSDLARAQAFYEDVLGFAEARRLEVPDDAAGPFLRVDPPVGLTAVYLQRGDFVLELLHFDRPGNPPARRGVFNEPGLTHFSVSVDDVAATVARAAELGAEVLVDSPMGAIVRDPDGQLVELLPMAYRASLGG
jgi:catechol 2,3-dioxygenase-like lactoylglutathione lyase family enzyme